MIRTIHDFARLFRTTLNLDDRFVLKKGSRYFLINQDLKRLMSKDFFYAGSYLGKTKNRRFFPGFQLLRLIKEKKPNRIIVDRKTEWLFICGRDVFKQGITTITSSIRRGDYVLVLNQHEECLGFGRVINDIHEKRSEVIVKNILDIGDFLRREKPLS